MNSVNLKVKIGPSIKITKVKASSKQLLFRKVEITTHDAECGTNVVKLL